MTKPSRHSVTRLVRALVAACVAGLVLVPSAPAAFSFGAAANFGAGSNPRSVAIGDLNADAKPDLAIVNNSSGNVSVLLGDGTGSFGAATNFAVGSGATSVAIDDLNADGKPDLAVTHTGSPSAGVAILIGDGTGGFG